MNNSRLYVNLKNNNNKLRFIDEGANTIVTKY